LFSSLNFTTPQNKASSSASSQFELIASLISPRGISSSLSLLVYQKMTSVKNTLRKLMNSSFESDLWKQFESEISQISNTSS